MAQSMAGRGYLNAWANVAASATDSSLVSAVPGSRIRVLAILINHGDTTASTVVFNSKPSGAGTAISPTLKYSPNGGTSVTNEYGFFETNTGEGLTVTTGAGSTTGISVTYKLVPAL